MAITSDLSSGVVAFHIAALGRNMGGIPVPEIPSKAGRRGPNDPVRDRLDVLPGIDGRAGRRADARRRLMIGKRDSVRLYPLAPRHRKRSGIKEVLLVDQNEQDVVPPKRCVWRGSLLRGSCGDRAG